MALVRKRQMKFLGHVIRADGLENLAVTGRIAGSRSRGRPRKKYLDKMKEAIGGATTQQLLHMTREREQWRSITGNSKTKPKIEKRMGVNPHYFSIFHRNP